MDELIAALKAAGEPTRLRVLAILEHHELTVSELVTVLGQSQPRVSRHLRVLSDAGLVKRQTEGTSAYYRIDRDGPLSHLMARILAAVDRDEPEIARDATRLRRIRERRSVAAASYFETVAADWDRMRSRHVPDAAVEAALADVLSANDIDDLLDLGTGTGRVLELAGPLVRRGVGVDFSRDMLAVARDKLDRAGLPHCHVRMGDIHRLDVPAGSVDAAVMHHVLHFLDDPNHAIAEAARTLRPGGLLVLIDFAPHSLEVLRQDYNHVRLGFDTLEIREWCAAAGLGNLTELTFAPDNADPDETLTVKLWTARQRADAPVAYPMEVAS